MEKKSALSRVREHKGLTQRQLAEKLGVDSQTVGSWERGIRFPSLEYRNKLVDVLDASLEMLGLQDGRNSRSGDISHHGRVQQSIQAQRLNVAQETVEHHVSLDHNRDRILKRIRSRWISGFLDRLSIIPLVPLDFQIRLDTSWQPSQDVSAFFPLSHGTRLIDIYDDASGELLLLGDAGAGKSTLLLELVRTLVERAFMDEDAAIPVIFNLSSWEGKETRFDRWLVNELHMSYQIPSLLAQDWIEHDRILLLLDGLDEVERHGQVACVNAINAYRQEHGLVSIVLSCRQADYEALSTPILLDRTVCIQPLTPSQVEQYVAGKKELEAMRIALHETPSLLDACTTPLMLSILTFNYYGKEEVKMNPDDLTPQTIFDDYVERLCQRRPSDRYDIHHIKKWIGWLAWQMVQHNQTQFYLERLQPDWLPDIALPRYRSRILRIFYCIQCLLLATLFAWMRGGKVTGSSEPGGVVAGIFGLFSSKPNNTVFGWMSKGVGGGLEAGGSLAIILVIIIPIVIVIVGSHNKNMPVPTKEAALSGLRAGIRTGLICGIPAFLLGLFLFGWAGFQHPLEYGFGDGIFCGMTTGLLGGLITGLRYPLIVSLKRTWRERSGDALAFAAVGGVSFWIVDLFERITFSSAITYACLVGIPIGIVFGLCGGTNLLSHLGEMIQPAEIVSWSWSHMFHHIRSSVKKGAIIAAYILLCVTLAIGIVSSFFYGIAYGIRYGLVYGFIIGCIAAFAAILANVLRSGWSSQMLEDQPAHFSRPNEGIRRSCKNALFAACVFGPIGGVMSGIITGVSFGVIGRLADWPALTLGFTIVFVIMFVVQFAFIYGGIAVLEHYVLRWYLWRLGDMPLHYVQFLDAACSRVLLQKIGGSYTFPHRILLEHLSHEYIQESLTDTKEEEDSDRQDDRKD